jgi:membrane associated rhomboid family serine protease
MGYSTRSYAGGYLSAQGLPPAIKWLLISNTAIYLAQFFLGLVGVDLGLRYFMLRPYDVVHSFMVWQLVTYMFLHGGLFHILFNMLALWMFGVELEGTLGTRRFVEFYFFCGVGAGVCVVLGNYLFGNPGSYTLGSSGAIYGILMAWAVLWPDRIVSFFGLFPMKVKVMVFIYAAIAFLGVFSRANEVSDVAHLSGLGFGWIFLKVKRPGARGRGPGLWGGLAGTARDQYRAWKLARAKRKFQVYLKKNGRGQGPGAWRQ